VRPIISLSHALADDELFGGTFRAASFWTWKTVAKLIDDLPLTEPREMELYTQCTGRTQLPNRQMRRALRRLIILCGRRAGKDRFLSAVAVWRAALCADWNKHISAGEQAVCLLLGADRRQAQILRKYCEGLLAAPLLAAEVKRRTDDVVEFRNGGALEIGTNDVRLIRGRSAVAVLGSECCFWRTDEHAASSDEEVVSSAEPSLAMCPDGGLLLLGSSVFHRVGYMYRQYKRLHGNDEADDICWFATSMTMNPKLPATVVENALTADALKARAEFENVWREDVDDFLPIDVVDAATDWGVVERPPERNIRYVGYADAASGTGRDAFGLAIGHAVNDAARTIVIDLVRERKPRFVAADVIREFSHLLRSYGISEIVSDNFAAGFCSDEWMRNGIQFRACANSTAENFLFALPLLTSKRARLVDDAMLRKQLSGLQRRVVGGHETVGHAQVASAHDDVAAAVAGCLVAAGRHFGPALVAPIVFSAGPSGFLNVGGGAAVKTVIPTANWSARSGYGAGNAAADHLDSDRGL
jgi:hypothetical protein